MNHRHHTAPAGGRHATGIEADRPQQAAVELYTLAICGSCRIARSLLRRRGIEFTEIPIETVPGGRHALMRRTGRMTAPQIVIDGEPIGGADSLLALDRRGALDALVRRRPSQEG